MYAPIVRSARRVRQHAINAEHNAVLLTDIEAEGDICYAFLLVVFQRGVHDPVAFVSSEVKRTKEQLADFLKELGLEEDDDVDFDESGGSHFLGAFVEDGHRNYGASDEWADEAKFEARAVALARTLVTNSA